MREKSAITKRGFHSISKKLVAFGSILTGLLVIFFLVIWGLNHYLLQQQDRLLNVQQQFSSLVYGLNETDSMLYSYAQQGTEELEYGCESLLEDTKAAAGQLAELLGQPIFTDLDHLVETYGESADALLEAEGAGAGQRLTLYQASNGHLEIIDTLMHEYNRAVDVDRYERQEGLEQLQKIINYMMVISCVLLVLMCILFFVTFSRRITGRIVHLTGHAEKICQGDWSVAVTEYPQAQDEVDVLANAFYRMLEEIREQIEQLKKQEAMERHLKEAEVAAANMKVRLERAQLRTLQSRVNPHFLFNTLNVIAGQAAQEQADTTVDMLLKTADYLRYSLNKLDKVVPLKEELQNVEDYFQIQKRRFASRLDYSVECGEDCRESKIPAMVLQPLCENALIHGVMPLKQGGQIRVRARKLQERMEVTVTDNGVGFSPERLEEIRERLKNPQYDDTQGIGLYNIMQRLQAWDKSCEARVESEPGVTTTVTLLFPVMAPEEKEGETDAEDTIGG